MREIGDEGIRLFVGIVAEERDERDIFPVCERGDIREICGEGIVGGKRDQNRAVGAQLCFCRHGDGGIGDAVRHFRKGIAGAGGDDQQIKRYFRPEGLRLRDGMNDRAAAYLLHGFNQFPRRTEARIRGIGCFAHDRLNLITFAQLAQHSEAFLMGTERPAECISDHCCPPPSNDSVKMRMTLFLMIHPAVPGAVLPGRDNAQNS